ncbi:VPLPA-CTERM sorting domain-containing protein [Frigidibacter sp. MR17.14]|uniref:VPLPA-CTERM sorting domain-containing protein n=1 Tax=Frigidibacter sp. MR17.14 TaxID=3126509 RepID=UPI003012D75E
MKILFAAAALGLSLPGVASAALVYTLPSMTLPYVGWGPSENSGDDGPPRAPTDVPRSVTLPAIVFTVNDELLWPAGQSFSWSNSDPDSPFSMSDIASPDYGQGILFNLTFDEDLEITDYWLGAYDSRVSFRVEDGHVSYVMGWDGVRVRYQQEGTPVWAFDYPYDTGPAPVPLPAAGLLLAGGLGALVLKRRRAG